MKNIIVAIDGHSACGKSSTAKQVAALINYIHIDSGAMYRAIALYFLRNEIPFIENPDLVPPALEKIVLEFEHNSQTGKAEILLNGENVENQIRTLEVSKIVSEVAANGFIRKNLVLQQKRCGEKKGILMDGRDIGTIVFPNAELKFFMTASLETRIERRLKELIEKGEEITFDEVRTNLEHRDHLDSTRKDGPLKMAKDSILLDTTNMTVPEQVNFIVEQVMRITKPNYKMDE